MGEIGILLILYAIQVHLGPQDETQKGVDIWIDNAEVLDRGVDPTIKDSMRGHMVLDYDLWRVMNVLQEKISVQQPLGVRTPMMVFCVAVDLEINNQ